MKRRNVQFLQDGAPCHTTVASLNTIKSHATLLQLPPKSPDLNYIEKLWHLVKQDSFKKAAQGKNSMMAVDTQSWDSIPPTTVQRLIESMPARLAAAIAAKGAHTVY